MHHRPDAPPPSLRYRPELDGVRALAVYLVVGYHAGVGLVSGGFIGVDLFFVLSGFLVSGVILREVDQRGTFSLRHFYARRVRRLLPAALVVVVAAAALELLTSSVATRAGFVDDARAALLYVANWQFIGEARDYFATVESPSPFLHFWSLSIEEQFYIGFPLVVLLALRWSRRPVRTLAMVVGVAGVASLSLQVVRAGDDPTYAYYATDTRAYQLVAGIGLTILVRKLAGRLTDSSVVRLGTPTAAAGLVAVVLVATSLVDVTASTRGILATAASVALVAGLWVTPQGALSRALALTTPNYLGRLSYATYLWHWPILLFLERVLDARPLVLAVLGAVLSTALAALSSHLLETPIRRAATLHRLPRMVVLSGLALSVLAAVVVVPPVLDLDRRPVVTTTTAGSGPTGIAALDRRVPDLDLVAAKADVGELTPTPCTADEPTACVQAVGTGAHVLLLGDSQAAMFTPMFYALAADHDLTVSTNVQNGCPWQADQVNERAGNDPDAQAACVDARGTFFDEVLPLMDVDVVVAIGLSRSDAYWEGLLTSPGGPPGESLDELQLRTTRATAAAIRTAGPDLVIVESIFGTEGYGITGFDPIECLAAADRVADCAVQPPLEAPAVDDIYGVLDTEAAGIATIDLTDVICPDRPLCHPIKGGTVIWKDRDHITASWFVKQREAVWRRLLATGLLA
ncbi:hypothetical protein NPS01_12460 [Nocardioides psychrotolerans]|uniref:Peptidoglycan/LPS O-acetylase OafA/YrhL, contains acyltransferase and SGNH-hydrolase domains n=1 Tax=Nocardioides psychrotolerans TaxID=1005945 RepID=A0A1I3DYS6_9ACTN|nr:acyltransferase family protein [Nocardioides psychrotolerans]GEP37583.1 hypothetical protein NPS01_12460 [Nocardioides psychrotolerans]SFH91892.1 Peptidoglycan/LPS O-acetylase OafA/YrhL, contains acyltransferase and SGNH-hydrolase domains [Nocardioides psychrotolerans]